MCVLQQARTALLLAALLAALLAFGTSVVGADVLPTPRPSGALVVSLEGVVAVETPLGTHDSISLWAGVGTVRDARDGAHATGGEVALEWRTYNRPRAFLGPSFGAYVGLGLFGDDDHDTHVTATPGFKITLASAIAGLPLLLEPYLGVSYPIIRELDQDRWALPELPAVTLGLRLVGRKLRAEDRRRDAHD